MHVYEQLLKEIFFVEKNLFWQFSWNINEEKSTFLLPGIEFQLHTFHDVNFENEIYVFSGSEKISFFRKYLKSSEFEKERMITKCIRLNY